MTRDDLRELRPPAAGSGRPLNDRLRHSHERGSCAVHFCGRAHVRDDHGATALHPYVGLNPRRLAGELAVADMLGLVLHTGSAYLPRR